MCPAFSKLVQWGAVWWLLWGTPITIERLASRILSLMMMFGTHLICEDTTYVSGCTIYNNYVFPQKRLDTITCTTFLLSWHSNGQ